MAGSNDLMLGPLPDRSGESIRSTPESKDCQKMFWDLAIEGRDQTNKFIESDGPVHAVRVFDFAMTISDMNNLIDLTAKSKDSLGRAYGAGVTNNGVYERQKAVRRKNDKERGTIQTRHGKYEVQDVFFGTAHSRSGCLYQVSTITVNGSMKLTFHPASPMVSEETNAEFADAYVDLLEKVAKNSSRNFLSNLNIPTNLLTPAAAALGVGGVAIHAGAWSEFFSNLAMMKENVQVRFVVRYHNMRLNDRTQHLLELIETIFLATRRIPKISGMHSTFGCSLPSVIPCCNQYCG